MNGYDEELGAPIDPASDPDSGSASGPVASVSALAGELAAALPAVSRDDLTTAAATVPGLARIAAGSWRNAAEWGFVTSWRITRRLLAAGRDPDVAAELGRELGVTAATITELARKVASGVPLPLALREVTEMLDPKVVEGEAVQISVQTQGLDRADLRAKGERLLQRSRDVWSKDEAHPAYDRILSDLAPDEARVLVLLESQGPQPSVDIRAGMVNPRLVAAGLSMIAARAGLRYADKVPAYLNNLHRLGLVWFSREQLAETAPYQVLEAQPDVLDAVKSVSFPKVVRRSIGLTPFGSDFVRATLVESAE